MDESILFSLGFLSQNSLWKLSLNRGNKGIYIVGYIYIVHHFGGLQPRATREIQPRVPASLHKFEQFFTLSHTLPLHDFHLNIGLLIAKIQVNLARNKANNMVD